MKSNLKSLRDNLLLELGQQVESCGFVRILRTQSFRRIIDDVQQALHLAFIMHDMDFDVTADIAIRFNKLEELINSNNKLLTKKEKDGTFSLGTELGNLATEKQLRWNVRMESDVKKIAANIAKAFIDIGLPYLEEFSDMARALDALSGDGTFAWQYNPIPRARAQRAVGLAFLMGDQARLQATIKAKTKYLNDRKDPGLQAFLTFVDSLCHRITGEKPEKVDNLDVCTKGKSGRTFA